MLLLPALLAITSCTSPKQTSVPVVHMGVVELSDGVPSDRIYLGSGENLVITARAGKEGRLDLEVSYDRRDGERQEHLASRKIRAVSNQPAEVSFAPFVRFTLTPRIKT